MIEISPQKLAELEAAVLADPGAACFPALAEVHRRNRRLSEAEHLLRQGLERKPDCRDARLVLAAVLLDQERESEAREELATLTDDVLSGQGITTAPPRNEIEAPRAEVLSDNEFEAAFESAETDVDEMIDPNRVAEEALDHVDRVGEASGEALVEPGGMFQTESMAQLLERQGDAAGAARIRERLGSRSAPEPYAPAPSADPPHPAGRGRRDRTELIATLERWLGNLRRR